MEGERILQRILKGESRQLHDLQNYTAPFEKILDGDLKHTGKKPNEYEKLCKYGTFCMKLLRYCIEAVSKGKKQGTEKQNLEDCFKCASFGADMLSKLITSGIALPSEISISSIIKLFFHLIVNALKQNSLNSLLPTTHSLVNITRAAMKSGQGNITKDSTGLCKQISDHLWNAAIKLAKTMDKQERAVLALSLREKSIDLLMVAKLDLPTIIGRGLQSCKQFQLEIGCSCKRQDGQAFLLNLLSDVITEVEGKIEENVQLFSRLEDLCMTCCKLTVTPSQVHELLRSFYRLAGREMKNSVNPQGRFDVFQCNIQILLCALCFRLKEEKELENHQYDIDVKWKAIQKRLNNTSEALRDLDSNLYLESQILLVVNYLRCTLSKIFRATEKSSDNLVKIPAEILSALYELLLVCYSIQSDVVKSKVTSDHHTSSCNTWEITIQPKLALLYLIASVVLKILNTGLSKTSENGRQVATKRDYVSILVEEIKVLDGVDVPEAIDQYIHYSCNAFNIALMLFNCGQINDATILARLSCEAGSKWYLLKSDDSNAIKKVALYKKYELLSDCLAKQGHWLESIRTMSLCCQYYVLSIDDSTSNDQTSEYVWIWSSRKNNAIKQLSDKRDANKVRKCNLDDDCRDLKGPSLSDEQTCMLLRMELESYRKKGYCTASDQLYLVEKLFNIYTARQDETNSTLMKLEKVKVMYHMTAQLDNVSSTVRDGLHICENLVKDVTDLLRKEPESIMVKDMLASVYFWEFILQYTLAVEQTKEKKSCNDASEQEEPANSEGVPQFEEVNSLNLTSNFLLSLHSAVDVWTELATEMIQADKKLNVYSRNETRWMLQIASSVYGFLNMPLIRIHTLLVLATFTRLCEDNEDLQTLIVTNSLAIQTLCEEGNISAAELLQSECEEIILKLGDDCQAISKHTFSIAKSQLFLCKGLHNEGWQLVKTVLDETKGISGSTTQFVLVKAKLLCVRYLSLPTSVFKANIEDADWSNYFDFLSDSTKYAEALVKHFVENATEYEFTGLSNQKKERAVFLSHWSLLSELSHCYTELGKVYLLQGAVREAKRFLQDGREITRCFLSPNRFSEFTLQLAELNVVLENAEQCNAYLKDAMSVLKPELSLSDIVDKQNPFKVEKYVENSFLADYESVSFAPLQISLVNCYCQYLKMTENISNVRQVITVSHDLRQCSVVRYQQTLANLEYMFAITVSSKPDQSTDELTHCTTTAKGRSNSKGKRGKTATKKKTSSGEFITYKSDIASLVFLESCLKTHSLDGDDALKEGDFARLLSNVQAGLAMVERAQSIVNDPFLLDLMSTSFLHYLQGVAHVLATKDGFNSWRVVGSHPPPVSKKEDIDMCVLMAELNLSFVIEKPTVRKSRRRMKDDKNEHLDVSSDEDLIVDGFSPMEKKIDKRRRGRQKLPAESSTARSKRTPASRKIVNTIPHTPLTLQTQADSEDLQIGGDVEKTKKHSRSCRTNTEGSKSSTKPKRNSKRNVQCDIDDSKIQGEKRNRKEMLSSKKNPSHDLIGDEHDEPETEDKDMESALDSFHTSLTYLHPCYNPILLTRICHAFVLCHGVKNPEKAAAYQNMVMATTLRHQTLNRSSKKIRKERDKQIKDGKEEDDELVKLFDSTMSVQDERKHGNQMLQLQTIKDAVGFKICDGDELESFKNSIDLLPEDLTVCTVSIVQAPERENKKHLVITRLRKNTEPLVLKLTLPNEDDEGDYMEQKFQVHDSVVRDLSSIFRRSILSDFAAIMRELNESIKIKSKREWWSRREKVDNQLKSFVQRMEETWFGRWRGILNGRRLDELDRLRLQSYVENIQEMAVELLGKRIQNDQLLEVLTDSFCHLQPNDIMKALEELAGMQDNCKQLIKFSKALSKFLDDNERMDNTTDVTRGPVVLILDKAIQHLPFEAMPILRDQEVSRMPSLQFITAHLSLQKIRMSGVDPRQTFYILNPQDDLPNTEKRFSDWFSSEKGWKGVIGRPPSTDEFKQALANHQLFIYMGHGNGREFLKGDEITRLYCQAVALIMGCSSGKLIVQGQCDARGMALNYLLSGSPTVVANLWDVTDRDIDKFTTSLLRLWFKETPSLTQCVAQSRHVCNMKYINGAAPIVYGMPVYRETEK